MSNYKRELEKWLSSKVPKKLKGNSKKDDFFKEVIQLTEKINNSNKSFRNKGYGNIRDNSIQVLINTLETAVATIASAMGTTKHAIRNLLLYK